ncbi:hypothetical protein GCM10009760_14800 [Kitasatospora kazusensis]|uniref:Uncharacterized protein n=1 Tax=Kitasatospora kazusensis TaxID=407974 RepID=A0ABN2Z2P7_9ACTN
MVIALDGLEHIGKVGRQLDHDESLSRDERPGREGENTNTREPENRQMGNGKIGSTDRRPTPCRAELGRVGPEHALPQNGVRGSRAHVGATSPGGAGRGVRCGAPSVLTIRRPVARSGPSARLLTAALVPVAPMPGSSSGRLMKRAARHRRRARLRRYLLWFPLWVLPECGLAAKGSENPASRKLRDLPRAVAGWHLTVVRAGGRAGRYAGPATGRRMRVSWWRGGVPAPRSTLPQG